MSSPRLEFRRKGALTSCLMTMTSTTMPELAGACCDKTCAAPGVSVSRETWAQLLPRLLGALLCAGWGMVLSLGVNDAQAQGELPYGGPMYLILHGGLLLSAMAVLGLLGGPLFSETLRNLGQRKITVEALFSLSLLGALVGSVVASVTGQGAVYYEVVAITLTIYTLGKSLGTRSRESALQAAAELREAFDRATITLPNGQRQEVPVASLRVGDRVLIAPGGAVTVDGVITEGRGYVRETPLTGEPAPVVRTVGEELRAGSHAIDGHFTVQVTRRFGQRVLDGVLEQVEQARLRPSQLQVQADALTQKFVPFVAGVSLLTLLVWWPLAGGVTATLYAMAVLLVACPCALGLATPIAVFSGLHQMARLGLVARSGDFLDSLARCRFMAFDKTGTLTEPQLAVAQWQWHEGYAGQASWLAPLLAHAQPGSRHPLAEALRTCCEAPEFGSVSDCRTHPGAGLTATLTDPDGQPHTLALGSLELMPEPHRAMLAATLPVPSEGPAVFVALDIEPCATITFRESWRDRAEDTLAALHKLGVRSVVLTGDPHPTREQVGPAKVYAGLTPQAKARHLKAQAADDGGVIFVGDGINDAPAMVVAEAAIAMGDGTALAQSTASAVLPGGAITPLPEAVGLARKIRRAVRQNLYFAASYNVVGMGLAAAGMLHPVAAVLLMFGSSIFVSWRAARSAKP